MIYLDNAATTIHKPPEVIRAVTEAMTAMGNAGRGAHGASLESSRAVYRVRKMLAELFGASDPRRIAFTANSTEALNIAIRGTIDPGDHVITTVLEHNSVLRPLYDMEAHGAELSFVGADARGYPRYEEFEKLLRPNTKAVVCTHASNLTGNAVDLDFVSGFTRAHGLLLIVDASQTAGVLPIDVTRSGIDILCFTGHKSLMGPQGTGGLYVKPGTRIRPLLSGGTGVQTFLHTQPPEMPALLEAGTLNSHGIAGLGAALTFIRETGADAIRRRETSLARLFFEKVRDIPGIRIYGDPERKDHCPIIALNIGEYDSGEVADELFTRFGVCTRPGGHCAPLMHTALGTVRQGAVRFSFSCYNTEEEAAEAAEAVRTLACE